MTDSNTQTPAVSKDQQALIERMFEVGAHYGYSKSKRHPSSEAFIFGNKSNTQIFDLEKTSQALLYAKKFVSELAAGGKQILFVSSKNEAQKAIVDSAESISQPYVIRRWIGGTLTNFEMIKKRAEKLIDLKEKQERGELDKYTKKEQLLLTREIQTLEEKFGGIVDMKTRPAALFIVDVNKESIAAAEAKRLGIPVIALSNNDCDYSKADVVIPGNDSTKQSISFFLGEIVDAYKNAKK